MARFYTVPVVQLQSTTNNVPPQGVVNGGLTIACSFDCDEWLQNTTLPANATKLNLFPAGGWTTAKGSKGQITTDANNSLGSSNSHNRGFRHWLGVDANGNRSNSGGISLSWGETFSFNHGEHFWVRWYLRFEQGFTFPGVVGKAHYFKVLYFRQSVAEGGSNHSTFNLSDHDNISYYSQIGDFQTHQRTVPYGCGFLANHGDPSHGEWVCYELYLKRESSSIADDGQFKCWVQSQLVSDHSDVTYGAGMSGFLIGSNADGLPTDMPDRYVDYDNFIVTTQTPANRDTADNPMIGPIGWINPV